MRLMALVAVMLALVTASLAQAPADVPGVRDTIAAQMEAFKARDPATAFGFASPFIQRQFQTPENFGAMVQGAYPMVWDPRDFAFVDQIEANGMIWQRVQIIDQSGQAFWFAYEMVQVEGIWRINGVYLAEAPDLAV